MSNKKNIRAAFRNAVFGRDDYTCRGCGIKAAPEVAEQFLDSHHIIPRTDIVNQGYVKENGITLCKTPGGCHEKAEEFFVTGIPVPGFSQEELFKLISSSPDSARAASERLK